MVHILENELLKVTIADKGAELTHVYDKESKTERIWSADPEIWNRHAPILFPFVGKTFNNRYIYKEQTYQMKTQHGFARDMEFEQIGENSYVLKSNKETLKKFPFEFELYVAYEVKGNRVITKYKIINKLLCDSTFL